MLRTSLLAGLAFATAALAACLGEDPSSAPSGENVPDGGNTDGGAIGTSSSFDVTVSSSPVRLVQEGSATLSVTVTRKNGFSGAIELRVDAGPASVSADPFTLGPAQTEGTLTLRATKATPQGTAAGVTLRASSPGADDATLSLNVFVRGKAGTLDTTYGNGGTAEEAAFTTAFGALVAVDAQGRVYAYGATNGEGTSTLLERITAAGKHDATFVAEPNNTISVTSVVPLPSGGVILCGQSTLSTPSVAVARFKEAGNLDTTFGNNGVATKAFGNIGDVYAATGACVSDGTRTLVSTARYGDPADPVDYSVIWADASGKNLVVTTATTSFGRGGFTASAVYLLAGGLQKLDPGTRARDVAYNPNLGNPTHDIAIAADGTAVAVGPTVARRFFPDGTTDQGFNAPAAGPSSANGARVVVQSDGKVVVLYMSSVAPASCQVVRYAANGSLDETFGEGGKTEVLSPCTASVVGLQPDGGVIIAGKDTRRYWGD